MCIVYRAPPLKAERDNFMVVQEVRFAYMCVLNVLGKLAQRRLSGSINTTTWGTGGGALRNIRDIDVLVIYI